MRIRSLRITSQVVFFVMTWLGLFLPMTGLIYPYYFCVGSPGAWAQCPLKILEVGFIGLEFSLVMLLYLIGFLVLEGLLIGRGVCGWACPVGFIQEVLYKVRKVPMSIIKMFKGVGEKGADVFSFVPVPPRYLKYLVLLLIPVTSWITGRVLFTEIDPIGGLTATIPALLSGKWTPGTYFPIKILLVLVFLIMSFIVMRAWCRFLCPLGAMLSPLNKVSMLKVDYDEEKCTQCKACVRACPMKIDVPNMDRDTECIICGRCVSACKFDSLHMSFLGKKLFQNGEPMAGEVEVVTSAPEVEIIEAGK